MPEDKPKLFDEILEMAIKKYPSFKKGESDHMKIKLQNNYKLQNTTSN